MKVTVHPQDGQYQISWDAHPNYRAPAICRIYLDDKRKAPEADPRPGVADIQADLLWRRQVDLRSIAKDPSFQMQIITFMREQKMIGENRDPSELHFGFSRYAGCAMCPCSPGIVVQYMPGYGGKRYAYNIWVDLED